MIHEEWKQEGAIGTNSSVADPQRERMISEKGSKASPGKTTLRTH